MIRDQLLRFWPDEDAVAACIKHEAETVDEAVFLAAHQPMQLVRMSEGAKRGTEQTFSEQDLLEEFLQNKLPEGRIILPIEGSSGVGKSHVIRWLHAQLRRQADRDRRHMIRVPKGMSLKGVLRLLLEGLEGEAYEDLRIQLRSARENLDPELAAKHLILNICHRLEQESKAAAARIHDGTASAEDKLLKSYGDKRALPALIGDSDLLHSHWLTREADGSKGVMARLAEQVTEVASGPEDTRQHQIRPEDLDLPRELVERLNRTSQRFYEGLHAGGGERLADAVRLINRVLDPAKQDLLQLGDGSLTDLFRTLREQLHTDGKELVLLVEDFAVLSGIQGALLQVMITEAYRDGKQILCTMRSALAYTQGVAHVPETVRTRARSLWKIEDQPGNHDEIHDRVVELVGAYLNAARVGQGRLRDAFEADHGEERWVPIVDGRDLEDDTKAVLDAFGTSRAGFPLFPFNRNAIRQLTEQGSRKDGALVFNPRNIINNVLNRVLMERREFQQGRFPYVGLAESLRSAELTSLTTRSILDRDVQARALVLLACWGDQPSTLVEAASLPLEVFTTFDLPVPAWGQASTRIETPSIVHEARRPTPSPAAPEPAAILLDSREKEWREAFEHWGLGQLLLLQVHGRKLRKWLAQAMLDFVPWGLLLLKTRDNADRLQDYVYIPRARGQHGLEPGDAFLVVATEAELDDPGARANIIRSLMALVRLYELNGSWTYESAVEDAALCAAFLDERAERAEAYLRSRHFRVEADTIPALTEALLVGARALGVEGADSRQLPARISALFGDAKAPIEPPTTMWGRNLARIAEHRPAIREWLLEQIGARQGRGAVHAVDVTAIEPVVHETVKTWTISHTLPEGKDRDFKTAANAMREVSKDLPKTLHKRREELLAWHTEATAWFGEEPDKQELRETLQATVNEARTVLPLPYDYDSLRRRIAALKDISLKTTLTDCVRLERSDQAGEILSVLARAPDPVVRATQELMREFDRFLEFYSRDIHVRLEQQGDDPTGKGSAAVREELSRIRNFLQTIQEARS